MSDNLKVVEMTPEEFAALDKTGFVPLVSRPRKPIVLTLEQTRWLRQFMAGTDEPAEGKS